MVKVNRKIPIIILLLFSMINITQAAVTINITGLGYSANDLIFYYPNGTIAKSTNTSGSVELEDGQSYVLVVKPTAFDPLNHPLTLLGMFPSYLTIIFGFALLVLFILIIGAVIAHALGLR